jgi:hypothetical protein
VGQIITQITIRILTQRTTIQPTTLFRVPTTQTRILPQLHTTTKHIRQHIHLIHTLLDIIQIIITITLDTLTLVIIITILTITTPIHLLTATGRMDIRCVIRTACRK